MPAGQCPHLTATLNLHVTITALTNNNVTSQMSDFNQIILIDMVVCRVPGVDWCHAQLYTTQQYPHHQSPVTSAISNICTTFHFIVLCVVPTFIGVVRLFAKIPGVTACQLSTVSPPHPHSLHHPYSPRLLNDTSLCVVLEFCFYSFIFYLDIIDK